MWKIFKRREEWVLTGLSALFLMLISLIFIWGINFLITHANKAFGNRGSAQGAVRFNIEEAKKILDARGFPE